MVDNIVALAESNCNDCDDNERDKMLEVNSLAKHGYASYTRRECW